MGETRPPPANPPTRFERMLPNGYTSYPELKRPRSLWQRFLRLLGRP